MTVFDINTGLAMGVHSNTTGAAADLPAKRTAVRSAVYSCQSSAFEAPIPSARAGFWNSQAAVQAQATESKTRNALAALHSVVANYLAFDDAATETATRAANAIPRDVIQVNDLLK